MTDPAHLAHIHEGLRHLALPIASLTLDPRNARKHSREDLNSTKRSLQEHGFRGTIVVQRRGEDLVVRAGNGRVLCARELGWLYLPCEVYEEGDDDAVRFAIRSNRTGEHVEWDALVLKELEREHDLDLLDLGFDDAALDELMREALVDHEMLEQDGKGEEKVSTHDAIDPDDLPDYEAERDYFMIKIEKVPPFLKDRLVERVNAVLAGEGDGKLVARAY